MSGSSVLQTMAGESFSQQRPPRLNFFLNAQVKCADGRSVTVRVRNLSSGGMKAEGTHHLMEGDVVTVSLRNIEDVAGHVVWSEDGAFGVQFLDPIDPVEVQKRPRREAPVGGLPYQK